MRGPKPIVFPSITAQVRNAGDLDTVDLELELLSSINKKKKVVGSLIRGTIASCSARVCVCVWACL